MRLRDWILLIPIVTVIGCHRHHHAADNAQPLSPARRAAVEDDVRRLVFNVAHDVTQEGPAAWSRHFADTPSFFMAVNGKLAFASGQAAAEAIPEIARQYRHIELRWGDDLRMDALTENLCVVAASYTEVIELQPGFLGPGGTHSGFFTALAEHRNGQWQFRNVHWSEPVPPSKAP